MDEQQLLAAILNSRDAYDRLAGRLNPKDFSEQGQLLVRAAVQFYKRDPGAAAVDRALVGDSVARMFANKKHADALLGYLADIPDEVSTSNVVTEYRLLRRHNTGLDLAARLGAGEHDNHTDRLIEKYRDLGVERSGNEQPTAADLFKGGERERFPFGPAKFVHELKGGPRRGQHIIVFGRPDAAKSLFAISGSAGLATRGYRGLYACNEEPAAEYLPRFVSRFTGTPMDRLEREAEYYKAEAKAKEKGLDNIYLRNMRNNTIPELEAWMRELQPDFVVVDQLLNLKVKGESRVTQLEDAARSVRDLGRTYDALMVSVTQAGVSGEQKLHLDMADIHYSNTGIQGACDAIIGIGVTRKYELAKRRMVTVSKGKVSDSKPSTVLFVDTQRNAFLSKPRRA